MQSTPDQQPVNYLGRKFQLRMLSMVALLGLVQQGRLCSIIPDSHAALLDGLRWARTAPLPDMGEGSRVGVIVSDSAPMGPLAQAVLAVARGLRLPPGFGSI